MMTDEQRGFWSAIRAAPEHDLPRVVYADWLEENGQPERAEFIRIQCALALLGPDRRKGRKERVALEPREKELLTTHGSNWLDPFRLALQGSNPWDPKDEWIARLTFRRGFVNGSHFGLEMARRLAAAGDTVEPVDHIWVAECGARYNHESVVELVNWPGAGCVLGLSIAWGGDADVSAIVRSGSVRNLRHLGVWHGKLTDAGVAELAAWPHATSLQSMDLKDNALTDVGARELADSRVIGQLRRLDLHGTQIGPVGRSRLRERFGESLFL